MKKNFLYSLPNDIIHQTIAATKKKSFEKNYNDTLIKYNAFPDLYKRFHLHKITY